MNPAIYAFHVEPSPSGGWEIWFPDLPGCSGWALTWEAIGTEARTVAEMWLESEQERGHPIPGPSPERVTARWPQGFSIDAPAAPSVIGVQEAAERLGVSVRRVQALAKSRGVGQRFGNYLMFTETDIAAMKPWKPGRPRLDSTAGIDG